MTDEIIGINPLYLVIGLGNPGRQYKKNRHNIGFMLVDRLADKTGAIYSKVESKALITKTAYQGHSMILAKPQAFMNLSGQPVSSLIRFYKIPIENLIVIYDDIDLPFGYLRLRKEGGTGGHKGMQSIIERLGSQSFPRLRIGIGRPPGVRQAASYVLKEFTKTEMVELPTIIDQGVDAILCSITHGIEEAMTQFNRNEDVTQ
jgi:PTH1 family peptidyl-tRNA hydrolase